MVYIMQVIREKYGQRESKVMPLSDKDDVLTTKEAIKYLKISKPTYLKYIRLGRIKAVKAGRGWRVYRSELYRFLRVQEEAE